MALEGTITYETATQITQNPFLLGSILIVWLFPLVVYLIVGFLRKARSPSTGRVIPGTRMIQTINFWIGFLNWFLLQGLLILLLIIFPVLLKLI